MKNNQENSDDNQIINTFKTAKIDFRLSEKMKEMLALTASKREVKMSQLLNHIIEQFYAEQAKSERLAIDEKRIQESQTKIEYALLDEKIKHQRGDFKVDEVSPKITDSPKKDYSFSKFLFTALFLGGIYLGWKYFQRKSEKKQKHLTQQWQSHQHSPIPKTDSNLSDKTSDKSSPTT